MKFWLYSLGMRHLRLFLQRLKLYPTTPSNIHRPNKPRSPVARLVNFISTIAHHDPRKRASVPSMHTKTNYDNKTTSGTPRKKPYQCAEPFCRKWFYTETARRKHARYHKYRYCEEPDCGLCCYSTKELDAHTMAEHGFSILCCDLRSVDDPERVCGRRTRSLLLLAQHKAAHRNGRIRAHQCRESTADGLCRTTCDTAEKLHRHIVKYHGARKNTDE